jgi:osomolarity two-component system phosphorelay intermediate protein YPD1
VLVPAKTISAPRAESVPPPPPAATERVGSGPISNYIDLGVFNQVLELDEEGDEDLFSKDMVDAYFIQAEKTFEDMDTALAQKKLPELSSLGHFLKGSSAALGVFKVQSSCEDIQHYGHLREGVAIISEAEAIVKIAKSLTCAREEYAGAKVRLELFYKNYRYPAEEEIL